MNFWVLSELMLNLMIVSRGESTAFYLVNSVWILSILINQVILIMVSYLVTFKVKVKGILCQSFSQWF